MNVMKSFFIKEMEGKGPYFDTNYKNVVNTFNGCDSLRSRLKEITSSTFKILTNLFFPNNLKTLIHSAVIRVAVNLVKNPLREVVVSSHNLPNIRDLWDRRLSKYSLEYIKQFSHINDSISSIQNIKEINPLNGCCFGIVENSWVYFFSLPLLERTHSNFNLCFSLSRKGASLEAFSTQTMYESIAKNFSYEKMKENLLKNMENAKECEKNFVNYHTPLNSQIRSLIVDLFLERCTKHKDGLFALEKIDIEVIKMILSELNPHFWTLVSSDPKWSTDKFKNTFLYKFFKGASKIVLRTDKGIITKNLSTKEWLINVHKKMNEEIFLSRKDCERLKKLIKIITLLENFIEDKENPDVIFILNFLNFLFPYYVDKLCYNLRGLDINEVEEFFEFYLDEKDEDFYSKFNYLSEGSYHIVFKTRNGSHTLGYQKFSNRTGYLFDPNFGLKYLNSEERHENILKMCINLDLYKSLKVNHHSIKIFEITKLV